MEQAQFDKIASEAFNDEMNKIAKGLPEGLRAYLEKKKEGGKKLAGKASEAGEKFKNKFFKKG